MFKNLSQNQKIALGVGAAVGAYFLYTKFIKKNKQADMPTTQSSIEVMEVPNQRRLIGQIKINLLNKPWGEALQNFANGDKFVPTLRTLSDAELTYLVSTFRKQPYDLEPKAKEILSKIGY
jgi:hypothetical protein